MEKTQDTSKTHQEIDQITRSNKKPKRKITNLIFDRNQSPIAQLEDATSNPQAQVDGTPKTNTLEDMTIDIPARQPPSFRDMLRGESNALALSQRGMNQEEEDDVSNDDTAPEELINEDRCPVILLTKEEKKRMRRPWKNTLIIKMFDGKLGYMGLMRKLKKKWSIRGELSLTYIGCKYFIARFTNEADYNLCSLKVLG